MQRSPSDPQAAHTDARPHHPDQARRHVWLAALHQIAIADGDFSPEEQRLLAEQLAGDAPGGGGWNALHHPGPQALAHRLGAGTDEAEQFLRTAVMVALADGHISTAELSLLRCWSGALKVGEQVLQTLVADSNAPGASAGAAIHCDTEAHPQLLDGLRHWLDELDPRDPAVARFLVKLIPAQCPFERDVTLFGHKVVHIPPMCKINPLYEQLVSLRFRCLCRLEDADAAARPSSPRS